MKVRVKGKIIGALWGTLSMVSMLWLSEYIAYTRFDSVAHTIEVVVIRILILPAFLSARVVLAPAAGALIIWPIASILFGVILGYSVGKWKEK